MNKTLTVALILATLPAVRAADNTKIRLGLATGIAPEYPGSDRYRASVNKNPFPALPTLSIQRGAFSLDSARGIGGEYLNENSGSYASAALNYDPGRREKSKNKARSLRGMGDVKAGVTLQLRAAQHLTPQIALTAAANFRLSGQKHHGNDYRLGVSGKVWQSDSDSITLAADLRLADRDYQQTYFGVTPAQGARSGYRTCQPKAGVYGYGVSAGWMHQFNDHWSAGVSVKALQLTCKAKNSPLVREKTQISGGAQVQYRF